MQRFRFHERKDWTAIWPDDAAHAAVRAEYDGTTCFDYPEVWPDGHVSHGVKFQSLVIVALDTERMDASRWAYLRGRQYAMRCRAWLPGRTAAEEFTFGCFQRAVLVPKGYDYAAVVSMDGLPLWAVWQVVPGKA